MRRLLALCLLCATLALAGCFAAPPGTAYPIRCPVTGTVQFSDDWHAPRAGGALHEGNDVFAPRGTPNVAVVGGTISQRTGARSGLAIWLDGNDGNDYFYAHFDAWEGGNRGVQAGETIGYTGTTGDAAGTSPHTHFEIHPGGGAAVNPYPSLDAACTDRVAAQTESQTVDGDVPSAAADDVVAP